MVELEKEKIAKERMAWIVYLRSNSVITVMIRIIVITIVIIIIIIIILDAELARNNVTYVPSGIITFYNTVY